jgi:hypothetical protein
MGVKRVDVQPPNRLGGNARGPDDLAARISSRHGRTGVAGGKFHKIKLARDLAGRPGDLRKNNCIFSAVRGTAQALAISTFESDRPCATRRGGGMCPRGLSFLCAFATLRETEETPRVSIRFGKKRVSLAKAPGRKGKRGRAGHFTEGKSVPDGCQEIILARFLSGKQNPFPLTMDDSPLGRLTGTVVAEVTGRPPSLFIVFSVSLRRSITDRSGVARNSPASGLCLGSRRSARTALPADRPASSGPLASRRFGIRLTSAPADPATLQSDSRGRAVRSDRRVLCASLRRSRRQYARVQPGAFPAVKSSPDKSKPSFAS